MEKTAPFSMRLQPDLKAQLQLLAETDGRSLTNYIEQVLKKHISHERTQPKGLTHKPNRNNV
jgi:predicted HicB family RNase H-like nuclease